MANGNGNGNGHHATAGGPEFDALLPWEQQQGENDQWYARFKKYLDLGPLRSIRDVVRQEFAGDGKRPPGSIPKAWVQVSDMRRWKERAEAFDHALRMKARIERGTQIAETKLRHIKQAKAMQFKAVEALVNLQPAALTPRDIATFLVEGAKIERAALGMGEISNGEPTDEEEVATVTPMVIERVVKNREDIVAARAQATPECPIL